ncbi:MAG: hypothetical protein HY525_09485 [Betaproteobacteria bacterium]|nr:hypothetical protein [Betaproteobacteria bacterium]
MRNLETRVKKLEAESGLLGDSLTRLSDAELDEEFVRAYAASCDAGGVDDIERLFFNDPKAEPVLSVERQFSPMAADIMALALKRAGRVFYDECADLSVEQIHSRVKAHIARLSLKELKNEKPGYPCQKAGEAMRRDWLQVSGS